MICPYIRDPFRLPPARRPLKNTPVYAYLPIQVPESRSSNAAFSPLRLFPNASGIISCPGAKNVPPRTQENDILINGIRLPMILGNSAEFVLVRDTQPKPPNPDVMNTEIWNQCHAYDINNRPSSAPGACNVANDVGNQGTLSVVLQNLIDQGIIDDVYSSAAGGRTVCSTYPPQTGRCNALIGGPPFDGVYSVLDPQCHSVGFGFVMVLYDPNIGPPKELDFDKVGTDGMSSDPKNQVSSRVIFETISDSQPPRVLYWQVRVSLVIRRFFADANAALNNRLSTSSRYSFAWYTGSSARSAQPSLVTIDFDSVSTTVLTDQVAMSALGAFVAIAGFAGTVWGAQFKAKEILLRIRTFLRTRKRSENLVKV
jgi:hypothetical protein